VDPLRRTLDQIVSEARAAGLPLVTIGAFAVRAYLSHPDARRTNDLDLVTTSAALPALKAILERRGFRVFASGPWWHGEAAGPPRMVVDVAVDAVVDLTSFERYPMDLADARERLESGGALLVPSIEDLLALKLLSARDKDILDVVALFMDARDAPDRATFLRRVEDRDLEIPVRRGYLEVIAAYGTGTLQKLWELRAGAPLDAAALGRAIEALHTLFRSAP